MVERTFKESSELSERTCDALVLAYSPRQPIAKDFYIPSIHNIELALGHSLREIYGEKKGPSHWADAVKLSTVANLNKLDERILGGINLVADQNPDYMNSLDIHLTLGGKLEHEWFFLRGDLYRFANGKREESLGQFNEFWNPQEKNTWHQIHQSMNEYTLKEFKKKIAR